ncbi:WD40-repeat-containing domain protein, partial [Tirmania nivea]
EPVPSPEGQKLMREGQFGSEEWESYPSRPNPLKRKYPHYIRLLEREIGAYRGERAPIGHQLLAQPLLPSTKADFVMHYDARCYSGQFSQDGNFFYSCSQDFRVRMYDTSNPYDWKHYKTVTYPDGRWTITDATLSPDNKMLAYSSITSTVYASNTSSEMDETVALDFAANVRGNRNAMHSGQFGIWSIRFSGDGREMVAGANDNNLYVYDIETRTPVLKMSGHRNDVNAVCFADTDSPHILFSGSDDTTLKVWDRRSMASGEAGVFCGHLEGLTYIDSKGDGRYVLSNAKDQTMKLWDIRKMMSPSTFSTLKCTNYSTDYDYRTEPYISPPARHLQDSSIVTYRSHSVLRTLIRCHFSPPTSSGSRYVYTGSSNGKVYIYNLDATIASVIDVYKATSGTRPWHGVFSYGYGSGAGRWKTCVRDASWHPNASVLAATSWNGYGAGTGSVTLHGW